MADPKPSLESLTLKAHAAGLNFHYGDFHALKNIEMPIQIFNWTSRPDPAFQANAAAAGFILVFMTLAMNGLAIWLRYRIRRNIKW